MQRMTITVVFFLLVVTGSCGHNGRQLNSSNNHLGAFAQSPILQPIVEWPSGLPVDKAQPWETLDGAGRVISSINLQSEFVPGVERFLEAGDVADLGEASAFASGAPGGENVSWAIYRIPLGAEQPGTIACDANLRLNADSETSAYYIGVGDYSVNTWHWYGPFSVSHVRFNVPDAAYTSGLGNLMLAVVAYDGADFNLVGLGVNARDGADTTAPPVPSAPTLTPEAGGVLAEWIPVVSADLAGYRVYADGNNVFDYIEGGTSIFIPASADVDITLSAVDVSGNESAQSAATNAASLSGNIPIVELTASSASGMRGDIISLTASGADSYDWDTNGDGTWDITADTTGSAFAVTTDMGIIRPALRAHAAGDGFWMGAVSLIIAGNSRPVVSATGVPQSGAAPLSVDFAITAEDTDGTIAEYAWDFDGDGIFDGTQATDPSPLNFVYNSNGLFNAKFRVTDNEGGWDVDTVAIQVASNLPPVALLTLNTDKAYIGEFDQSDDIIFDARPSYDPEGGPLEYAWDTEGTGGFSTYTSGAKMLVKSYASPGTYQATVRVRDAQGMVAESSRKVNVYRYEHYTATDAYSEVYFISLFSAGGFPAVTFYDYDSNNLTYFRAMSVSPQGPYDWTGYDIETVGDSGHCPRPVVLNNGCPAIAYQDMTNGYLKFAVANNPTPSSIGLWSTHAIDTTPASAYWTSLGCVMNNGYPIISYSDVTNSDLKFARATVETPSAPADWNIHTVDSGGAVGEYSSISVIFDGTSYLPAIAYYDSTFKDLKYALATVASPSGAGDWIIYTLDNHGMNDVGRYNIAMLSNPGVNNGNPVVAYTDYTDSCVKLAIADILLPQQQSDWNVFVLDYSPGMSSYSPSVLRFENRLLISYSLLGDGTRLAKAKVANPASAGDWWFHTIDSNTDADWWGTSLAEFNGKPLMAYCQNGGGSTALFGFAIPTLE